MPKAIPIIPKGPLPTYTSYVVGKGVIADTVIADTPPMNDIAVPRALQAALKAAQVRPIEDMPYLYTPPTPGMSHEECLVRNLGTEALWATRRGIWKKRGEQDPNYTPPSVSLYPTTISNTFAPFHEEDVDGWAPKEYVDSGDEGIDDFGFEETAESIREDVFQRSLKDQRDPTMVAYQNSLREPVIADVPNNASSRRPIGC